MKKKNIKQQLLMIPIIIRLEFNVGLAKEDFEK